jgi:hypothetical protein
LHRHLLLGNWRSTSISTRKKREGRIRMGKVALCVVALIVRAILLNLAASLVAASISGVCKPINKIG